MSLKRKDIIWLMESYGSMPVEPCGRGKEESNLTINGKPDHEVSMASKELDVTARYAQSLAAKMDMAGEANLPAWVQSKITKAADYISKVYHYLEDYLHSEEALVVHTDDVMMEKVEGEIARAKHEIEIDLKISKSDMEKLHDGETITLKDKTGSNLFTVKVSSA